MKTKLKIEKIDYQNGDDIRIDIRVIETGMPEKLLKGVPSKYATFWNIGATHRKEHQGILEVFKVLKGNKAITTIGLDKRFEEYLFFAVGGLLDKSVSLADVVNSFGRFKKGAYLAIQKGRDKTGIFLKKQIKDYPNLLEIWELDL